MVTFILAILVVVYGVSFAFVCLKEIKELILPSDSKKAVKVEKESDKV